MDGVLLVLTAITLYGISIKLARPLQQTNGALPVLVRALGLAALFTAPLVGALTCVAGALLIRRPERVRTM